MGNDVPIVHPVLSDVDESLEQQYSLYGSAHPLSAETRLTRAARARIANFIFFLSFSFSQSHLSEGIRSILSGS